VRKTIFKKGSKDELKVSSRKEKEDPNIFEFKFPHKPPAYSQNTTFVFALTKNDGIVGIQLFLENDEGSILFGRAGDKTVVINTNKY